jgi:hypothetical protein
MKSNITKVYYEKIDPSILSIQESSKFYFFHNLNGITHKFHEEYERHEMRQMQIRKRLLSHAIDRFEFKKEEMVPEKSISAISSIKDVSILMCELI